MGARTTPRVPPSRRKMIEVMTLKGLATRTQQDNRNIIAALSRHYDRPPQALTADGIRSRVPARIDQGLRPRTTNADIPARVRSTMTRWDRPTGSKACAVAGIPTVFRGPFPGWMSRI